MFRTLIYLSTFIVVLGLAGGVVSADIKTGLVGYWPLDEGTGDTTADMSGNGHDGTLHNGATWILPGYIGEAAMNFDGNPGSRVAVGTWDPGERLTLAVWARWTGEQNKAPRTGIIGKRNDWSAEGIRWFLEVMTSGEVRMRNFTQTIGSPAGTLTAFIDQWAHIAITFDGSTVIIYLNAEEVGSGPFTLGPGLTTGLGLGCKAGNSNSNTEIFSGDLDEARIYNRALTAADVKQLFEWTGVAGKAYSPIPADGQTDVSREAVLSWTAGEFAPAVNGHRVYLSESFNDVNDSIGGATVSETSYAPGQRLNFDTTYYWRVDEVNAPPDSTVFEGDIWSFTTEPVGYPIDSANIIATASSAGGADFGAEKTIDGSGLNADDLHSTDAVDMWLSNNEPSGAWIQYEFEKVYKLHEMWVWNSNQVFESLFGFGFKDVTIEYSTDGAAWTALADVPQFPTAPGRADYAHNITVDFGGAAAKFVKLTANSNWGGVLPQYGLSEVRFFSIPVIAREPSPGAGSSDVNPAVNLAWRVGREVARHDLYLSTDEQAVIDGTAPAVSLTDASYSAELDLGSTYYWRIDEVNDVETPTIWQGEPWSFSTADYLVVDDFESYNDIDPPNPESHRIFESWIDGYDIATNGALVGNDLPPYAEMVTVHGDAQAMPLFYTNTGGATYSEAQHTFAPGRDWTKHGIQTLVLYFHGTPGNTGQLYLKVNGVKLPYPGDAADIAKIRWQQWNIDLASLGIILTNVTTLTIGVDGNGAAGTLYVDDIVLYRAAPPMPSEEIWLEAEAGNITSPMMVYTDPLASGGSYIGTDESIGDEYDNPPADGIATYSFTVAGGTYKISGRINIPNDNNSFWVRIQGAMTPAETELHSSGWVRWNDPPASDNWFWNDVFSDDDDQDATVLFTMDPGTYVLEIARREAGAMLDVILISKID